MLTSQYILLCIVKVLSMTLWAIERVSGHCRGKMNVLHFTSVVLWQEQKKKIHWYIKKSKYSTIHHMALLQPHLSLDEHSIT